LLIKVTILLMYSINKLSEIPCSTNGGDCSIRALAFLVPLTGSLVEEGFLL
jgi:hypothetical protein